MTTISNIFSPLITLNFPVPVILALGSAVAFISISSISSVKSTVYSLTSELNSGVSIP